MSSYLRWSLGPAAALAVLGASFANAEVKTREVQYQDGKTVLTGVLAWDDALTGKRPGILVVHEWWGLNDYAKGRAEMLAKQGYVAFALDMYGDNKVTNHPEQAGAWMKEITSNMDTWRRRAEIGLGMLKVQSQVDGSKLAAIGYCFGGSTVMQMAYAGLDLKAVVSFHGALPPAPESAGMIKPRVLVAHGRDDQFIPTERVTAFQNGLDRIKANWEMTVYSGTRHGFTNPDAGSYGIGNLAYNERADKHSWAAMMQLFEDVF